MLSSLSGEKFGPIGWNKRYDFMNSDLTTAILQLKHCVANEATIDFPTLLCLIGEITFGGRITDQWDKRTNNSLLKIFLCEEALRGGYKYSESGVYTAPSSSASLGQNSKGDTEPTYG